MVTRRPKVVRVNDKTQRGYSYSLVAPIGRNFDPEFRPELTPKEMLALGVFCGKYLTDCREEFPASWFAQARLSTSGRDCSLNYFSVDAVNGCRRMLITDSGGGFFHSSYVKRREPIKQSLVASIRNMRYLYRVAKRLRWRRLRHSVLATLGRKKS